MQGCKCMRARYEAGSLRSAATGCDMSAVWVSASPSVWWHVCKIHLFLALTGWLRGTNGVRSDLVSNGALGQGICISCECVRLCTVGSCDITYGVYVHPGESPCKEPSLSLPLLDGVEKLESEQVFAWRKKNCKGCDYQKDSCDVIWHPYAVPAAHVKGEKTRTSAGHKFNTPQHDRISKTCATLYQFTTWCFIIISCCR